ncbi:hypothetical protein CSOJ01_02311 [Colletotrichum sojae]|uniref:Uncharacterized protein n=1 Tax=Colletotrichum sojae TaxID=2175907 RepID=A0A8H6JRY6_9PEZI|nr:hypothetical protein CSOJ01_02311 [Colletotrichum sojae]
MNNHDKKLPDGPNEYEPRFLSLGDWKERMQEEKRDLKLIKLPGGEHRTPCCWEPGAIAWIVADQRGADAAEQVRTHSLSCAYGADDSNLPGVRAPPHRRQDHAGTPSPFAFDRLVILEVTTIAAARA